MNNSISSQTKFTKISRETVNPVVLSTYQQKINSNLKVTIEEAETEEHIADKCGGAEKEESVMEDGSLKEVTSVKLRQLR